ncbi:MAG TPA: flagellar hook capping FlgD N-terminal domain-containing protein [Glaciihabitans sp.]|jgi:flagellar basal-body rod modification protein FlgD|nr:flagellar hook capping FlgD N-terminal domain-containing protein [Glaciihabitans sp.]
MAIEAISPAASVLAATTGTAAAGQEMDSDLFMKLLVTQLRNQDPSSPMDTNEMITQTTQLATMEKLQTMADTSTESFSLQMRTVAAALVGSEVSYQDADGATQTGVASAVSFATAVPQVTVGESVIPLDLISGTQQRATSVSA